MANMGRKTEVKWSWSDRLAIALACLAGVLALILFWVEKTPISAGISIAVMAAFMVYPILHFCSRLWPRLIALTVVAGLLTVFGWNIWPKELRAIPQAQIGKPPSPPIASTKENPNPPPKQMALARRPTHHPNPAGIHVEKSPGAAVTQYNVTGVNLGGAGGVAGGGGGGGGAIGGNAGNGGGGGEFGGCMGGGGGGGGGTVAAGNGGNGAPAMHLVVGPPRVEFGSQEVGIRSDGKSVGVTNPYSTAIPVVPFMLVAEPRFKLDNGDEYVTEAFQVNAGTCAGGLVPNGSCALNVYFTPMAEGPEVVSLQVCNSWIDLRGTGQQ